MRGALHGEPYYIGGNFVGFHSVGSRVQAQRKAVPKYLSIFKITVNFKSVFEWLSVNLSFHCHFCQVSKTF